MHNQELVNANEVAEILGVSPAHVHRMNNSGRLPTPIRLGRLVKWCVKEIQEWIAANCPPRVKWEAMKGR